MARDKDSPVARPKPTRPPGPCGTGPPVVTSDALLAGCRELVIRHGNEDYRLRITGNNKLILTK